MNSIFAKTVRVIAADVVIVGAGFGGVTAASHIARRGARTVVLLEKEPEPGVHSSGLNAGMIRQVTSEETVSAVARKGAAAIRRCASERGAAGGESIFRPSGSLLIASGAKARQLERDIESALRAGVPVERWDPEEARRRFPVLLETAFETACFCPSDGVVDLKRLMAHFADAARAAGATLHFNSAVLGIAAEKDGSWAVRTDTLEVRAPLLVNAAGPWAPEVAAMAGATPMPLRPRRRHIFVTVPLPRVPPDWPFIWDLSTEVYFRPEAGGLLLSPCDEGEPRDKDSSSVDPWVQPVLEEKLSKQFPRLKGLPLERGWSGLRTLTPDGKFVLGPDPRLKGFFWLAGLGGHGVTSSDAVGELAADLILDPKKNEFNPHRPDRFGPGT